MKRILVGFKRVIVDFGVTAVVTVGAYLTLTSIFQGSEYLSALLMMVLLFPHCALVGIIVACVV